MNSINKNTKEDYHKSISNFKKLFLKKLFFKKFGELPLKESTHYPIAQKAYRIMIKENLLQIYNIKKRIFIENFYQFFKTKE